MYAEGGSGAMGLFNEFMDDKLVRLIGVEPAGYRVVGDEDLGLNGEAAPRYSHSNSRIRINIKKWSSRITAWSSDLCAER